MKRVRIVQAALLLSTVVLIASCSTSRDYGRSYPPRRPQANFSLIISSGPGMMIARHPSGRYYYRDNYGHIYWRGYGNRYYLDRRYVNRSFHSHRDYNDWRRYNGRRR